MIITIIIISLILFLVFIYRLKWLDKSIKSYTFVVGVWALKTNQPKEVIDSMSVLWPLQELLFNWAHWNLKHFIMDHENFNKMNDYIMNLPNSDV